MEQEFKENISCVEDIKNIKKQLEEIDEKLNKLLSDKEDNNISSSISMIKKIHNLLSELCK